jgi:flagellar hook-associated protein 2
MASIDGLITGMNTTDTINQLMKLEAAPQTALKTKITTENKVVSAYQSVNTRLSSIATAAKALGSADTWGAMKATSSSDSAAVSAGVGAGAGSLSFRVKELAATQTVTYRGGAVASPSDAVLSGDDTKFTITVPDGTGTKTVELTARDKSLKEVVAAINGAAEAPYTAAAVQIGAGKYTLQLTAKESGKAAADAMEALGGPTELLLSDRAVTLAGADARLTVGEGTGAYDVTSKTNTFADVLAGVTVTATRVQADADGPVTIKLAADADGIAAKVQALVDNANVALSEIASQSKIKSGDVDAGPLVGDSAMRQLSQNILGAISAGVAGIGSSGTASLNDVGVSVDRSGKLTFDKDKFTGAFNADPANTRSYFDSYTEKIGGTDKKFEPGFDTANGVARKLEAIALIASEGVVDPTNPTKAKQGTLQALIQQGNDAIKGLNDQVSEWDVRLESRKTALQKQFSGLEVALGKMQQQSSWLAGQLAGLA